MSTPAAPLQTTPSQTAGPYLHIGLTWDAGATVVDADAPGAMWVTGHIVDGAGEPVADALVETWQADADGRWRIRTIKPGAVPGPDGTTQAPHVDLTVHARGLLHQALTRVYFADEGDANAADPVLAALPDDAARTTLLAVPVDGGYQFDIRLQGDNATVFFDA